MMEIVQYIVYTGLDSAIESFLKNNALLISGIGAGLKAWAMVSGRAPDDKIRSLITSFFKGGTK